MLNGTIFGEFVWPEKHLYKLSMIYLLVVQTSMFNHLQFFVYAGKESYHCNRLATSKSSADF